MPSASQFVASVAVLLVSIPVQASAQSPASDPCRPGTTEVRPGNCRAPSEPPPSIIDYRPKSTLVTAAHLVKAAKYPAIDFHGHPEDLIMSAQGLETLRTALDRLNVRMLISADNLSGSELRPAAPRGDPNHRTP